MSNQEVISAVEKVIEMVGNMETSIQKLQIRMKKLEKQQKETGDMQEQINTLDNKLTLVKTHAMSDLELYRYQKALSNEWKHEAGVPGYSNIFNQLRETSKRSEMIEMNKRSETSNQHDLLNPRLSEIYGFQPEMPINRFKRSATIFD